MPKQTKIKAVIMDGDGSTLTAKNELPENLKELIIARPEIKWIMATGRSLELLQQTPIAQYLSRDVPHVVDGGARLMYMDSTNLVAHFMSNEELKAFLGQVDIASTNFIYYSPDGVRGYTFSQQENFAKTFKFAGDNVTYTTNFAEFSAWLGQEAPTKILLNTASHVTWSGLNYHQNDENIDITTMGIDKGSACYDLICRLNLSPEEVVFVFNDKNDLPVILHPQLSALITVKVGPLLPKIAAQYTVSSPEHVAIILNELLQ